MQIHRGVSLDLKIENAVVTSGIFDGVHLGHQFLLNQLVASAKKINGQSVVLTFWPHPKLVIQPQSNIKLITDLEEKLLLLKQFGIDHVWIIPFNRDFSLLSSQDFIQEILIKNLKAKRLIIGYDHKFGKNREGSFQYLIENRNRYPFEIEEIAKQSVDEMAFSSSLIRKSLANGDVERCKELMGHNYSLAGTVIKGKQNGRKIGFPTANIKVNFDNKLIPSDGSYFVKVRFLDNSVFTGMLNIGKRPTLEAGSSIEVYIIDFEKDIYGENLVVEFYKKIREEIRFQSIELLKEQLKLDKISTLAYFEQNLGSN